ncbi:MAG: hypothetical protein Q8M07_01525 [Prosthecobacter sp.]|nr:hypothetical protein [Prosthecobacter sp.]
MGFPPDEFSASSTAWTENFFITSDPASGQPDLNQWRLILRLHSEDNDFYNDLGLVASKLLPPGVELTCGVITDDEHSLAFLSKNTPLWPGITEVE